MRIVVMQPYHFPSAEHLFMANEADAWVVLDLVGYSRKSWVRRNRLRDSNGPFWFGPHIHRASSSTPVGAAAIREPEEYFVKLQKQLRWYQSHTFFGNAVMALVSEMALERKVSRLTELNLRSCTSFFSTLGICQETFFASDLLSAGCNPGRGLWALEVATALKADSVLNPAAGIGFFDLEAYKHRGVNLFAYSNTRNGHQSLGGNHLSWLDSLAFEGERQLKSGLSQATRLTQVV